MDSIGEALYKAMSSEHHAAEVDWTLIDACVLSMCQLLVVGKATVTMKKKGQPVSQDLTQVYESTILPLVQDTGVLRHALGSRFPEACAFAGLHLALRV